MMNPTQAKADLAWWWEILHNANRTFHSQPAPTREEIELGASDRELSKMAAHMATLSTPTRKRIEGVLLYLADRAGITLPEDPTGVTLPEATGPWLRVVEADAG